MGAVARSTRSHIIRLPASDWMGAPFRERTRNLLYLTAASESPNVL